MHKGSTKRKPLSWKQAESVEQRRCHGYTCGKMETAVMVGGSDHNGGIDCYGDGSDGSNGDDVSGWR